MEIWELKFANLNLEVYAWGKHTQCPLSNIFLSNLESVGAHSFMSLQQILMKPPILSY